MENPVRWSLRARLRLPAGRGPRNMLFAFRGRNRRLLCPWHLQIAADRDENRCMESRDSHFRVPGFNGFDGADRLLLFLQGHVDALRKSRDVKWAGDVVDSA